MQGDHDQNVSRGVVSVAGAQLHYRVEGNGIPCLIAGSSLNCSRLFRPAFRCCFVDTRGFVPTIEPYDVQQVTIDTYSDDFEAARRALGLGRVLVIGHSIHGTQALEYARRYPQSVWGVVAIAAPARFPIGGSEFFELDASASRKAALRANLPRLTPETLSRLTPSEAFIETYVANGPRYWYDPHYDAAALWEGVYVNVSQVDHLFGTLYTPYEFAKRPGKIEIATLLVLGRYDYVVPYSQWEDQRNALPQHTYALFDRSGHTPQLEEPERFDHLLLDWARRYAPPMLAASGQ